MSLITPEGNSRFAASDRLEVQHLVSRRACLQLGSSVAAGISLPSILSAGGQTTSAAGLDSTRKAKSCIVLFLLGGPPQQDLWDPKPLAPVEVRGETLSISTRVPGLNLGHYLPLTAAHAEKLCLLRACRTGDNAHSSSGYAMTTGVPHSPLQVENVPIGAPNDHPCLGAVVRRFLPSATAIPSAITLPESAANDGNIPWPGQTAGFLGRADDPWLLEGNPDLANWSVPNLEPLPGASGKRMEIRGQLLAQLDQSRRLAESSAAMQGWDIWQHQAFRLVHSAESRRAFRLEDESAATREAYGRSRFGQSVLLARRLVEAGVGLIQVNWCRIDNAVNGGHWDTHQKNREALETVLCPRFDQAYSALLTDLAERGLLDETLVVCVGEFGRTPKINANGGRDHWGNVFSVALAGGGVKSGYIHGESDRLGGEPLSGVVTPADLSSTLFHQLGVPAESAVTDLSGRPHPVYKGRVVSEILA